MTLDLTSSDAAAEAGEAIHAEAGRPSPLSAQAAALNVALTGATPERIIATAADMVGTARLAIVSSFGAEAAVLLAAAAFVDDRLPVLILDTGHLFPETLAYRDLLRERLGLRDVRAIGPDGAELTAEDPDGDLYATDPDRCCALRKVRPLARALAGFDAWANGRKRFQAGTRAGLPIVEPDGDRLKFNPLAALSPEEIKARFEVLDLPRHPLEKYGYASIGCMPCTSRVAPGEDARSGRWRGSGKVECGIHTGPAAKL